MFADAGEARSPPVVALDVERHRPDLDHVRVRGRLRSEMKVNLIGN